MEGHVSATVAPVADVLPPSIAQAAELDCQQESPPSHTSTDTPSVDEEEDAPDLDLAQEALLLTDLATSAAAAAAETGPPRKGRRRGRSQKFCIVDDCGVSVDKMPIWFRKTKCCMKHSRAPEVSLHGVPQRLCQKCSRFHTLDKFDGLLRSCREKLELHNEARKKRLREEKEAHEAQRAGAVAGVGAEGSHGSASTAAAAAAPRWTAADVAAQLQAYGAEAHGSAMAAAAAAISELAAAQQAAAAAAQAQVHRPVGAAPLPAREAPAWGPLEKQEPAADAPTGAAGAGFPRWGIKRTRTATPTMSLGDGPSAFHLPAPRAAAVAPVAPPAPAPAPAPAPPAAAPWEGGDLLSQLVAQLQQVQQQGGVPPPPPPASLLPSTAPVPPTQHHAIAAVLAAAQAQQRQHATNLAHLNTLLRVLCHGGPQ